MILGAGITGLAAAWTSGFPVYEASENPGGICSSYYVRPGDHQRLHLGPEDGEAYRFEIGGGHWIFGGDSILLEFIKSLTPIKFYHRKSSVFFPEEKKYVPYPIQNHLAYLDTGLAVKAVEEMVNAPRSRPQTMVEWLTQSFGQTLAEKFFNPFHELYTANLYNRIAPQDAYKTPVDLELVIKGAFDKTPAVGYNATFVYPEKGLNVLALNMAERCKVHYGKRAVKISLNSKEVEFSDGSLVKYDTLISTLPLDVMLKMTGIALDMKPDPYTSVLVLNIGATKGQKCPDDQWLYIPRSKSGFHRVGFYDNVDVSFLPKSARDDHNRVSIYVEKAFKGGEKPSDNEIAAYARATAEELTDWGFIDKVEVNDPTWIDAAYTWSWPGSTWKNAAIKELEKHGIYQTGRYGRWVFQGIAASIKEGFLVGTALKP